MLMLFHFTQQRSYTASFLKRFSAIVRLYLKPIAAFQIKVEIFGSPNSSRTEAILRDRAKKSLKKRLAGVALAALLVPKTRSVTHNLTLQYHRIICLWVC